LTKLKIGNQM